MVLNAIAYKIVMKLMGGGVCEWEWKEWGGGADLITNILDSAGMPRSVAMTTRV